MALFISIGRMVRPVHSHEPIIDVPVVAQILIYRTHHLLFRLVLIGAAIVLILFVILPLLGGGSGRH
jgi:hypothetical protein